jgi:hypothetical protein
MGFCCHMQHSRMGKGDAPCSYVLHPRWLLHSGRMQFRRRDILSRVVMLNILLLFQLFVAWRSP